MTAPAEQVQPYARCKDCDATFADRDAMSQHLRDTLVKVGRADSVVASSHRAEIVNPSPEELQAQRVRSAIESALDDLYSDLDRDVGRGHFTEEEVRKELSWFDLEQGWDDYVAEAGS